MNEFEGTNKDWVIDITNKALDEHPHFYTINTEDKKLIALVNCSPDAEDITEEHANVYIIRSAPELLEALQRLLKVTAAYTHPEIDYARGSAKQAINKALNKNSD